MSKLVLNNGVELELEWIVYDGEQHTRIKGETLSNCANAYFTAFKVRRSEALSGVPICRQCDRAMRVLASVSTR